MKRAIYMNCDGLGTDWISPERTPELARLSARGLRCSSHRAVFPSVTRASAASIATGCRPARHGLHGNRMGLIEDGRLVVRDVGWPDFRDHMRKALGRTLRVPTMAERVAAHGGFVAYSNVSPGAAYFLDPDEHGEVRHRAASHGPGRQVLPPLEVSHDLDGDARMTEIFCADALGARQPAISVLWLANPDLTLHGVPLGSPLHLEALKRSDAMVGTVAAAVERRRRDGEDILLVVGSDHGQESIGEGVDLSAWTEAQGFALLRARGELAFATQGTAVLVYAIGAATAALPDILARLEKAPWVDGIATGRKLEDLGAVAENGLVAAVNLARRPEGNAHGVAGQRVAAFEGPSMKGIGFGQHGGWGPDETRPFLIIDHPRVKSSLRTEPTSLVDVAPTMLGFLGLGTEGMDGRPIGAGEPIS